MPRGPQITEEVRRFIAEINEEHPDWSAKEVMNEVQDRLRQVNHQVKPNWPGLTIVQITLKKIREKKLSQEPLGIDSPWNIGRLADHEIPPSSILKVLKIQELKLEHEPLTVREARWIGRLHTVTDDIVELAVWATLYAGREKACEEASVANDTYDIDSAISPRVITMFGYYHWLIRQGWIPDSYKQQVAEEQTLKYERIWGLEADRPELTTDGWLLYASLLQQCVYWDEAKKDLPKLSREYFVHTLRLLARHEGKVPVSQDKYDDLLEIMKTGKFNEKSFGSVEKFSKLTKDSAREYAEEAGKFNDPEFVEALIKTSGSTLRQELSKIAARMK